MWQIRKGCFETNSSSLHSICIYKDYNDPANLTSLRFGFGDFGHTSERYASIIQKAAYLWTAICNSGKRPRDINQKKKKIKEMISEKYPDIRLSFAKFTYNKTHNEIEIDGYVDHARYACDFIEYVLQSSDNLFRYLFGDKSFVQTGNDYEPVDYPYVGSVRNDKDYTIFSKGN